MSPKDYKDLYEGNKALGMLAGLDVSHENAHQIKPLAEVEQAYIEMAIKLCNGNIPEAARHLNVSPSTLYRKKSSWGLSDTHEDEHDDMHRL